MLDRVAVRKGVWQRYQGELAGALGMNQTPDDELIRRVVKGWHDQVRVLREKRLQNDSSRSLQMESSESSSDPS